MKKVIDDMDVDTGWSGSGASVHGLNSFPELIAGNNDNSLIFNFTDADDYVEKTYTEDLTDYDNITLWIRSINKGNDSYRYPSDYVYKIDLGSGKEYYLPAYKDFYWISINVSDLTSMERIRITAVGAGNDYLVMSYVVASKDLFPLDIFTAIKEQIEYERDTYFDLKNLGTITGNSGDDRITFASGVDFLDRHGVVKIVGGGNTEYHIIRGRPESNEFTLGGLYDGRTLQNDYVDADVYLFYPVEFGNTQKEIVLPSISIWGFAPERILITNELDKIIDTVKTDDTFQERQVGHYLDWSLLIDCEAQEEWELVGYLSEIVRRFVSKKVIWINGRKGNIDFEGKATEVYPNSSYDIIPKVQYPVHFELREDIYTPTTLPKTTTINVGVNIAEQGEL